MRRPRSFPSAAALVLAAAAQTLRPFAPLALEPACPCLDDPLLFDTEGGGSSSSRRPARGKGSAAPSPGRLPLAQQLASDRHAALMRAMTADASIEVLASGSVLPDYPDVAMVGAQVLEARNWSAAALLYPMRRESQVPGCEATRGPRDDPDFLSKVRPCGNLSSLCTDIPLVEANKDYPGGGIGAVLPNQDYVVQFDVGLHPEVAREVMRSRLREIDSCVSCPDFQESCYEAVVTGGAMWGNLGLLDVGVKAYDCMGGCGQGCSGSPGRTHQDVGALDCLKHDLCSAWKSVRQGRATKGYCHDPDCGDEAAMALFNCWRGFRFFGSVGGSRRGPFSEPVICAPGDVTIRGCWNHGGWFTQGRCKVFQGWSRGQGIPDPHPLRSPIQRL